MILDMLKVPFLRAPSPETRVDAVARVRSRVGSCNLDANVKPRSEGSERPQGVHPADDAEGTAVLAHGRCRRFQTGPRRG